MRLAFVFRGDHRPDTKPMSRSSVASLPSHLTLVSSTSHAYETAKPPQSDRERGQNDRERRVHTRLTLSELPWLDKARLKYGPLVTVIDLSTGGAQIEIEGHRLQPGSTVVIEISRNSDEVIVPAQVLRCQVAGLSPNTLYRGALAFKRPIAFPTAATKPIKSRTASADPLREQDRLRLALKRWSESGSMTTAGADALAATLALMETPAARRAGARFSDELSRLFSIVALGLEQQTAPHVLLGQIAERLRRVVPARTIRLVAGSAVDPLLAHAPLYFDVPSHGHGAAAKLLLDFSRESAIEEWHFPYLKAAVHLVGLLKDLEPTGVPKIEPPAESTAPAASVIHIDELPPGLHRVVVRYNDGRLMKGYSREFTAAAGALTVLPEPDAPPQARISVPLGHLKAVFFVRDFEGDPTRVDATEPNTRARGRRIIVTFLDGETLVGTTLNYTAEAPGFFIRPIDAKSNNVRVFIATQAIRQVQFS